MQVIENLTRLRGLILRRVPHPSRVGYDLLTLQVNETQAVDGKADLLGRHMGGSLDVAVRSELIRDVVDSIGANVDLRAKMTPDGALAEPHPEPGNFAIATGPDSG
ncbi:hypothetical protein [Candidatus Nitrotoga arctica]|uniref:Uncharacterized protein n=1 Tax=Candidatus Nitrotoga arctica TaxID=453162 RepID=A0ABN8AMY8_9PROT|nr:hypothetical protein [Candidatus Nitrotoga arctica]CAG9932028.1 conserved protein of unknown function [Candidatus Nitrotoga arctica]